MPSLRTAFTALLALGAITPAIAQSTFQSCYSSFGGTKSFGTNTYQSLSACKKQCADAKQAVYGVTKGSTCFCGNSLPDSGDKVDMDNCDVPCQGYPQEVCGGDESWLFGYTGIVASTTDSETPSKSSSKPSTSVGSDGVPVQTTIVNQDSVTITATPDVEKTESTGGTTNTAGIAAGAVVGVVALVALGVGGFLYVRRNRRRQAEEEYRAAVAAKEFTASIRKPTSDARLDPVMLQHRRLSDGSIADNEDYSRRILKVTNPDA